MAEINIPGQEYALHLYDLFDNHNIYTDITRTNNGICIFFRDEKHVGSLKYLTASSSHSCHNQRIQFSSECFDAEIHTDHILYKRKIKPKKSGCVIV